MVKVFYGPKGTGKTKQILEQANLMCKECNGDVVFMDTNKELMYDLKHEIRFVDVSEYDINCDRSLIGFISGMISQNYDIECILIDGLTYILNNDMDIVEKFIKDVETIANKSNLNIFLSISGTKSEVPSALLEYIK